MELFIFSDVLPTNYEKTVAFLVELVHMLLDYVRKCGDRSCKVLDFHQPHSLREMMGHCLDLHAEPQDLEQILSDCKETLKYCVKTGMVFIVVSVLCRSTCIFLLIHHEYKNFCTLLNFLFTI